ncbi:MAG: hypothetical protein PGN13_06660 [Patulibacter minatonensis]
MIRHRHPAAAGLALAVLAVPLAGCTTTQERSASLKQHAGDAAHAKAFAVGRTNAKVRATQVTTLAGEGANTVVVRVENSTGRPQVVVPIGVDLYDAKKASFFSNRVDGLDMPLNNIPVAEPGTSWWVNNQLPGQRAARTRVRIGTSKLAEPPALPQMKVSDVKLEDDAGTAVARGKVENLSTVEQKRLTIFAVALKGDEVVAAGRAVVEKLAPKGGKRMAFNIYFTGDPTGAKLEISAPPSTLGGAS